MTGLAKSFLMTAALTFAFVTSSFAQGVQGGIRGAVGDAGGVTPGANVSLINESTSASRNTVTNAAGQYVFTDVLPGLYTIKVVLTGYRAYEYKGIRIGAQQFITLDVTLEVGGLQEVITVVGGTPPIETSNASVSSTLDKVVLETLPTAGRNAYFLAVTTPNVIPSGDPQFVRQQDQTNSSLISLGGGPRRGNNYTLEGVAITDMRNRAVMIPSIEAVEEVKVQVSTYDAEMGRTGGGVFNTLGRSGSNRFRGSGLYQNRPGWGQGKFFFARNQPKPDTYFHLYGGSFGGPLVENRTFFWAATEGYQTKTARNSVLTLPTERERTGDFSQTFDAQGRLVTIFNPTTTRPNPSAPGQFIRDPFPGNVIPTNMLNPVSRAMLNGLPLPTNGKLFSSVAELIDVAKQATIKLTHRPNDSLTLTGLYAWYDSEEPEARFYRKELNAFPADPGDGALFRTVHSLALNSIWVPTANSVYSFRYGYNSFVDSDVAAPFDLASLGFNPAFVGLVPLQKFPRINVNGYGRADTFLGDRSALDVLWYSHSVNASTSRLLGRQALKAGIEYRNIGLNMTPFGQGSGEFTFSPGFTQGPNPNVGGSNVGDAFASFLLGYPASGNISNATRSELFIHYFGAFVQDDVRFGNNLTVNLGLRYEFEQGLQEKNNGLIVGFERNAPYPVQVPGLNLRGGLQYAGLEGFPTHQMNPTKAKFAPRVGLAYTVRPNTVVRAGYGLYWAPVQFPFQSESGYGLRGYTAVTDYVSSFDGGLTPCPGCNLANPFPNGIAQPVGNAAGRQTGVGGSLTFVDQESKSAYVHQYSSDLQFELKKQVVMTVGYVGSRSERLGTGGTNNVGININQIPLESQALGAALQQSVPNPFFGNPAFGALSRNPTIARGQLLRPYPQFTDITALRAGLARARYNAFVVKLDRRLGGGWGANINYTLSHMRDNQVGEGNFFSNRSSTPLNNYDLEREFGLSLLDQKHRLNVTATYELPFGVGRRWLDRSGLADRVLGGWQLTIVGSYASGYPLQISQANNNSGLLGSGQRPNLTGTDPNTSGSTESRIGSWINPAAFSEAAPFTFGNAPRVLGSIRAPGKYSTDLAIQKAVRLTALQTLQLRFEIINAFDNPNFLGPNTVFGNANFGRITEVGGFPRTVQLLVRLAW